MVLLILQLGQKSSALLDLSLGERSFLENLVCMRNMFESVWQFSLVFFHKGNVVVLRKGGNISEGLNSINMKGISLWLTIIKVFGLVLEMLYWLLLGYRPQFVPTRLPQLTSPLTEDGLGLRSVGGKSRSPFSNESKALTLLVSFPG